MSWALSKGQKGKGWDDGKNIPQDKNHRPALRHPRYCVIINFINLPTLLFCCCSLHLFSFQFGLGIGFLTRTNFLFPSCRCSHVYKYTVNHRTAADYHRSWKRRQQRREGKRRWNKGKRRAASSWKGTADDRNERGSSPTLFWTRLTNRQSHQLPNTRHACIRRPSSCSFSKPQGQ